MISFRFVQCFFSLRNCQLCRSFSLRRNCGRRRRRHLILGVRNCLLPLLT